MKIHKIGVYSKETLCGLNITSSAPDFEEPVTDDPEEVTCPDCFEQMGGVISKDNKQGTYTSLPIQPWHFAETNSLSFLEGCVVKRVCRHRQKDGAQDIDKAIDELKKLKSYMYGESEYEEADCSISEAIKALSRELRSEPGYYLGWQSNIAIAFKDEIDRVTDGEKAILTREEAFSAADKAAGEFLDKLKD